MSCLCLCATHDALDLWRTNRAGKKADPNAHIVGVQNESSRYLHSLGSEGHSIVCAGEGLLRVTRKPLYRTEPIQVTKYS